VLAAWLQVAPVVAAVAACQLGLVPAAAVALAGVAEVPEAAPVVDVALHIKALKQEFADHPTTDFHLLGPIKLWWEKHQCFSLLVKPPEQRWVLLEPTSCKGDASRC